MSKIVKMKIFFVCTTRQHVNSFLGHCGCMPLNMKLSRKVPLHTRKLFLWFTIYLLAFINDMNDILYLQHEI